MKLLISVQLLTVTIFVLFSSLSYSLYTDNRKPLLDNQWSIYKSIFNKMHTNAETITRRAIWEKNLIYIQDHNLDADLGKHNYNLGMNHFGDLSHEEYEMNIGTVVEPPANMSIDHPVKKNLNSNRKTPISIDWQKKGHVTSVKYQGRCKSSVHHGAVAIFESSYSKKTGKLTDFSVQQMLDCSDNGGCEGHASVDSILEYIEIFGIYGEKAYPYKAKSSTCNWSVDSYLNTCMEFGRIKPRDEGAMQRAVANIGPIAVYMDGSRFGFRFYRFGIYRGWWCSKNKPTNVLTIVGYGKKAWKVKNSYGKFWGWFGYSWISKDEDMCGISAYPMYVVA